MGPELLAAVALGSAAVSAVGAIQQGRHQSAMAEYNARVAENDAVAAKQAAGYEEDRFRDRAAKVRSAQRAAIAKSGIDLEGSPLAVMEETAVEAEMDALAIRQQGSVESARARSRAALDRMEGRAAKSASYWNAASSVLNGVTAAGVYGRQPA